MIKTVLITGGMGFIGNHLAHRLLTLGFNVMILDKVIHQPQFLDISSANIIEGDVLSKELLSTLLSKADACFHLAALSSVALSGRDWIFSHENNVLAFNGLLESLRHTKHFVKLIYASSAAVYGNNLLLPAKESSHVTPTSPYGADKLSNELYATVAAEYFQIPSIGLRFFNVYGPGQRATNAYSGVISCFKEAIFNDKPCIIYGSGQQTRDFVYVEDVVDACLSALYTAPNMRGIFNICTGKTTSIKKLATIMLDLTGKKLSTQYKEARFGDIKHSYGDPNLAKKHLKFEAKITIEKGLNSFIKQAQTNRNFIKNK